MEWVVAPVVVAAMGGWRLGSLGLRWSHERRASSSGRLHVLFGGKVDEDAGFIRKRMARKIPPELRDRRDWEQIEGWAGSIAAALGARRPEHAAS